MSPADDYRPIITRLPEALQEERDEAARVEAEAEAARVEAELSEGDAERLERESE